MIVEPDAVPPLGLLRRPVVPTVALRPRIELRSERSDNVLGVVSFLRVVVRREGPWRRHLAHLGSLKFSGSGGGGSLYYRTPSGIVIGIYVRASSSSLRSHHPMLVEGGAEGDLGPHRQKGAEGDDAQAGAGEQPLLPLFVVGREQLHPPPGQHLFVIPVTAFAAASAGCAVSVAGAGASEWTGAMGELQSRCGVDGSFAG